MGIHARRAGNLKEGEIQMQVNVKPLQLTLAPVTPPVTETTRRFMFLAAPTPSGRTVRAVLESCGVGFDRYGRPVTAGRVGK